jgi:hypothetical protein
MALCPAACSTSSGSRIWPALSARQGLPLTMELWTDMFARHDENLGKLLVMPALSDEFPAALPTTGWNYWADRLPRMGESGR